MENQTPTFDQLLELFNAFLSGQNEKIAQATKILKKYSKLAQSVGPFVKIITESQNQSLKHLATILLRKNILQTFQLLDEQAQTELKAVLLQTFSTETLGVIKKQLGYTIGIIAQLTLKNGQWNELFQVLEQQTNLNADAQTRKNGIQLLSTILDFTGESMKSYFESFYQFFSISLQDKNKEIQIEAVKCLLVLFDCIHEMTKKQIDLYKELITPLLQILDQLVSQNDEDNVSLIIEAFDYLGEAKLTILDSHFKVIVEYCISQKLLLNPNISFSVKEKTCDLLFVVAQKHRSIFNKNPDLLKQTLECLCYLVATPFKQDDLESNENIQDCALWTIGTLAHHLSKKKCYGFLLTIITQLIHSEDFNKASSGFLILATIAEPCADQLIKNLSNPIMNDFVIRGLNHENAEVRASTIKCLGFFAEWFGGALIEYHSVILPQIVGNFKDLNQKIQERAMITLDIFCDSMEQDQITIYLAELIPQMIQVPYLQNVTLKTKRAALSCIASCASTAGKQFRNYIPVVYKQVHELVNMQNQLQNEILKAEAINILAKITSHFSKDDQEVHETAIKPCLEQIYQLLSTTQQSYYIKEACFSFFYNLADAIGSEFGNMFDQIIDITLKSAASQDGIHYKKDGQEFSLDTDSEEETHEGATSARVDDGFIEEKSAAIHALGSLAVSCPLKFQPYFEKTLDILESFWDHFNETIRQQCLLCYKDMAIGMIKCTNNGVLPEVQKGLPCNQKFPQQIEEKINVDIWHKFCTMVRHDAEKEMVAHTLECITYMIKDLGPAFIHNNLDDLYDLILDVLELNIDCLKNEDEEDEEEDETDGLIFETLTDTIPQIAETLQDGFLPGFQKLFPSMMAYCTEEADIDWKVQMVGCFCEIFNRGSKQTIQYSMENLFPRLLNAVTENDDELSRNTSYCLGLMIQNGKEFFNQDSVKNLLIALKYVFEKSEDQATKDNAASSLCRVLVAVPDALPFEAAFNQILPLLPFQGDNGEQHSVLNCIIQLSNSQGQYMQNNIEKIIALFVDALANLKTYEIKDDEKTNYINFLKQLANQYGSQVEACVMKLEQSKQTEVIAMLK